MSAASNDNEQASDLDEPMGSQSQVRSDADVVLSDWQWISLFSCFMLSGQDSEFVLKLFISCLCTLSRVSRVRSNLKASAEPRIKVPAWPLTFVFLRIPRCRWVRTIPSLISTPVLTNLWVSTEGKRILSAHGNSEILLTNWKYSRGKNPELYYELRF